MTSRFSGLSRDQLALLVPELLLIGQLIDRSGMAYCIQHFGREEMLQVAIEEWASSSPIYTRRMQRALRFEGDDVITIFKGMQLDIGAPPQFMDFRYTVHDKWHGEFHLDHCGALLDVEPLGPDYVTGMCHDIEDPTFDATAFATNPHAQVRPIHRPPRTPADRHPHCAWTVTIDESYPAVSGIPALDVVGRSIAAGWELDDIDTSEVGASDYAGPLLSDLDFGAFSHSALVRIADEICVQMHLLFLGFSIAVRKRAADAELARTVCTQQLIGLAGVAAARIKKALGLSAGVEGVLQVMQLHPLLNPAGYVNAEISGGQLHLWRSPAHEDSAWISLCGPAETRPLQAIATAVDPHVGVQIAGDAQDWTASFVEHEGEDKLLPEVMIANVSGGSRFVFEPRKSLPLTVV
ncbi:Uncharacterised protein [Mycobacteroides abscessus subsp. bolletii]|uniref:Uncharacterized protein n=1 Tax=Mycobacteroides abscessus subsp. bolletii TaxID=319705 RepID=A0A9Q7WHY2_9MYCO|nr:hypothetical protein [Mycobacteroides abscessus]SHU37817.1 Uncharacterised protein [Mycobacteroides abscessus subsp. bolletii]SHV36444.1 Uncharacterised protein [Mycobacteroides abscessus subsp. bolletii]SHX09773.1 Uncharacterised protein [Mycobacteroides abscessus subsp. bolletii]SKL52195.1 Uncharacterised protein [Mycobacteroides abscessus subsp. bolletii]SKM78123.1 Uncharacterised protein [Mycobacteroides abscessus subsp. bolletii]